MSSSGSCADRSSSPSWSDGMGCMWTSLASEGIPEVSVFVTILRASARDMLRDQKMCVVALYDGQRDNKLWVVGNNDYEG